MGEQQTRYTSIEGNEKNEVLAHRYHMDLDMYLTIIHPNTVISCTVLADHQYSVVSSILKCFVYISMTSL